MTEYVPTETEKRFIDDIACFQKLTVNWSKSKTYFVGSELAMPVEHERLLRAIIINIDDVMIVGSHAEPNWGLFEHMKLTIPKLKLYPLERDSFGWVVGCLQVNQLKIVF